LTRPARRGPLGASLEPLDNGEHLCTAKKNKNLNKSSKKNAFGSRLPYRIFSREKKSLLILNYLFFLKKDIQIKYIYLLQFLNILKMQLNIVNFRILSSGFNIKLIFLLT